jgi:hypothetical protein
VRSARPIRCGGGAAAAALLGLACGEASAPGTRACAEILALQVPGAELVEAWPGAGGVALTYRTPDEDGGGEDAPIHRLECVLAQDAPGRLRAQSLRVDDRRLSEAEVLLVNSELLLGEIRRADPGPPGSGRWKARIEALLASLF